MSEFDQLTPGEQERFNGAAAWWERLREEPSRELSAEFLEWIDEPANRDAFSAIETVRATLDEFRATPTIIDMRRAALTRFRNGSAGRLVPRKLVVQAAAAILVVALASGAALYVRSQSPAIITTDVGERRLVPLPDGSRIGLDSDTQVEVHYSKASRAITLDRGRARFDVAHDVARPFTVTAGAETVVAVGTSFDVERLGAKIVVTLIQGHVLVKEPLIPRASVSQMAVNRTVSLVAGEQLVAAETVKPVVTRANIDAATAWEAGHLIFFSEPLAQAVARVNRYTDRPIIVDPSAASIPISGIFNAGDVGSFVDAITAYFPVEATTNDENRITLQRRRSNS